MDWVIIQQARPAAFDFFGPGVAWAHAELSRRSVYGIRRWRLHPSRGSDKLGGGPVLASPAGWNHAIFSGWIMWEKADLLLLIIAANGTPILLDKVLGARLDHPLDAGLVLPDGQRLLGASATLRGAAGAVLCTAALASLLGHGVRTGALVGALAMVGDGLSSFVKRRLLLAPGDKATGLDQVPESLLPLLAVAGRYGLSSTDIVLLVSGFTLFDMAASRLLYRMHIRRRPH